MNGVQKAFAVLGVLLLALQPALLLGAKLEPAGEIKCHWEPVGPGGGGGMFFPSFSPHAKGKFMTLACDMGGTYRSTDNGLTWQMMDFGMQRRSGGPVGYDPADPNVLFSTGYRTIWKSTDAGKTWKGVASIQAFGCPEIVVDPKLPRYAWAAMAWQAVTPIFASADGGSHWRPSGKGIPDKTEVRGLYLDLTSTAGKRRLFAATNTGFYLSLDNGSSWTRKETGLEGEEFLALTGCSARVGRPVLFAAIKGKGVYRYDIASAKWDPVGTDLPANGTSCKLLAMARNGGEIVYGVCGTGQIFRSDDRGDTWRLVHDAMKGMVAGCWVSTELGPGWAGNIQGIAVNPTDPNEVVFTDFMRACRSRDGGRNWEALYTRRVGDGWRTTGLDVTTTYSLLFAPRDPARQFITCTDIGLLKSSDNGLGWRRVVKGVPQLWTNTCYDLCFDPADTARIWGAFSRLHDLPFFVGNNRGGICVSSDGGESWEPCSGLPNLAGTSIILDPKSGPASRTLYAGLYQGGVYKSTDGGSTWSPASTGLPAKPDVWRLLLHSDGTLLCSICFDWHSKKAGGVYKSSDGGGNWTELPLGWNYDPLEVAMDPRTSRTIYVSSLSYGSYLGGLRKSSDGGRTWRTILSDSQVWGVTLAPTNPDTIYACCLGPGSGPTRQVLRSGDGGQTWSRLSGLPFYNLHSVTVDPRNPHTIYVTTFGGGVWKTTVGGGK